MKATQGTEIRTVNFVIVETDNLSFRVHKWHSGMVEGPRIKIIRLAHGTARNYGFSLGHGYSIKEYGGRTHYVGPSATVVVEGKTYKMVDFYNHILTL